MASESTTSTLDDVIPSEDINDFIDGYPLAQPLARALAWEEMGHTTVAYNFPRFDATSVPAGNKTEGSDATRVAMATSSNSATPLVVAMEIAITDEAPNASAISGLPEALVMEAMRAMRDRVDSDAHAVAASATSTSGAFTDTMDEDKLLDGVNTFIALDVADGSNMPVAVLGHSSAASLRKSSKQSSAADMIGSSFMDNVAGANRLGVYGGVEVWESGNVATESGGNNNYITMPGRRQSGIGLVVSEELYSETNRSAEGARAKETYTVFAASYGTCVTHASRITEVRSL